MSESRDSITDVWGPRTPFTGEGNWPERVDMHTVDAVDRWVQSCCVLCSNGCALDIGVKDNKIVGVRGRAVDRVNKGRLGPKGMNAWIANNSPDRLTTPLLRKNGKLEPVSWEEAMTKMVSTCSEVKEKYTSGALAIYDTGQLFLEDYVALAMVAKGGLRTNHTDGNTRLCTATAAQALKETFGSDGQPGTYDDLDITDCIFLAGHNPASTQTVMWSKILDRLAGQNPPKLIVLDPRFTECAKHADVHLAPKLGTNVAVMNGLLNLVIANGKLDQEFIQSHTVGCDALVKTVEMYTPSKVEEISGIPQELLRKAGQILGETPTLHSSALQGIYQSHQATAAACQMNNLHLIRGLIGKPGSGLLQMNGQPTAQNTRETGCNGEYPGFLNHQNADHMNHLAKSWNVEPHAFPHGHLPTHALQIFRFAELGSIRWLWIIATNPAVSMPELHRIRRILANNDLFVVVQDAFMTETTELADLVLPAAIWGEKTGTFTNTDRTVHISDKAVDPPGEAKSDLDIFLDFAKRMDFKDKDGQPLIKFTDAESAFEHWREFSKGLRPDYSGLTYEKLRQGSGIQWPCNEQAPNGTPRLYTDHVFPTSADDCETFGHDLQTGAQIQQDHYRLNDPAGKAIIKSCHYEPPQEQPDDSYPFWLTTGRNVYQFHTRTKTGRSPQLQGAAPHVVIQISAEDAAEQGITDGEELVVVSRRGTVQGPAQIGDIVKGHVFVPFHYGHWDDANNKRAAANEVTMTYFDPVSKQPLFKCAAVQVHKANSDIALRILERFRQLADVAEEKLDKRIATSHQHRSHLPDYLYLFRETCKEFQKACDIVSSRYLEELDLKSGLHHMHAFAQDCIDELEPTIEKYGVHKGDEGKRLREALIAPMRTGSAGILHDMHDLYVMTWEFHTCLLILDKAAKAIPDKDFIDSCERIEKIIARMQDYFVTRFESYAAQALIVPS